MTNGKTEPYFKNENPKDFDSHRLGFLNAPSSRIMRRFSTCYTITIQITSLFVKE